MREARRLAIVTGPTKCGAAGVGGDAFLVLFGRLAARPAVSLPSLCGPAYHPMSLRHPCGHHV